MAFDECLMRCSCKHTWQLQRALFFFFFLWADRIIVVPDEGRTGSDLAPEVSGDHLCRATAVRAINQNTSLAKMKATIRVVIIVLVNTVPEYEMLCESWMCSFVVYCIAACLGFLREKQEVRVRL